MREGRKESKNERTSKKKVKEGKGKKSERK